MAISAQVPLIADRWTAFVRTLVFRGVDLTGADFRAQVRLYPDALGAPLIDLQTVSSAAAQGLRLISVVQEDGRPVSRIGLRINESTMEAMPQQGEIGTDLELAWDLHVTPAGGLKQRRLFGPFIVRAGVTQ